MADRTPANPPSGRAGLLVVGHGTRDPRGAAEFARLVRAVVELRPEVLVEGCFLELVEPNIGAGIESLIARGATRIAVVPLLLVAAGHARRDIPRQLAAVRQSHTDITIWQSAHLGCHAAVLELAHARYEGALRERPVVPRQQTLLLVVGRGTNDPAANAELCHFARLRWERAQTGWLETCFLAMTEPSLARTLEVIARLPFSRIVVAPHFLFQGELLERLGGMVAAAAARQPDREFVLAERLGWDDRLAQAIVELSEQSLPPGPNMPLESETNDNSSKP